jgi:redox-sensitive bicupin YhaK (pirin superfamily)
MTIKKTAAEELFIVKEDWRTSRYHFSFADYVDPRNDKFGVLRALNEELIQPKSGFSLHPHNEMEIISYCVEGELSHSDSMGNHDILKSGDVQYMCAGAGIEHAEMNDSTEETLRFMQIWILPDKPNLTPRYGHKLFSEDLRLNKWLLVASSHPKNETFKINQDANIYISKIQNGNSIQFELGQHRQNYLVCMDGKLSVNGIVLSDHEAARINDETQLIFKALEDSHVLLVEMAEA